VNKHASAIVFRAWTCSGPVVLWSCGPVVLWSRGPGGPVVLGFFADLLQLFGVSRWGHVIADYPSCTLSSS
jgi:hypothetical protein